MSEIYLSTDVETDGPLPGPHSMLSLGCAAYRADKSLAGTFSVNLETLPGAAPHPDTLAWWETQPEAWKRCRENPVPPARGMHAFVEWIEDLAGSPVFVGYPVCFDFVFVYWYLMHFVGRSPFGFASIDIRSYAMGMLARDYGRTSIGQLPERWLDPLPHTHVALDDALEQGALFCNMLKENTRR